MHSKSGPAVETVVAVAFYELMGGEGLTTGRWPYMRARLM